MRRGRHRNALGLAIEDALADAIRRGAIVVEPVSFDLFASPAEARLFKRRRGRPPTAHAKSKRHRRRGAKDAT